MPTKRKAVVSKKKQKKIKTIDVPVDLGRFRSRAVTVERFVDMDKLVRTGIPNLILDSNLENLMEQKGQANVDMVREFFHGIIRPYDTIKHKMVSVLRGVKVEFSVDSIAKFLKVDRPNPYDERQYPFWSGVSLPDKLEIAKALYVNGITPTDEWCVRFLKPDVSVLHVMVWYNLDPRGVKNAFNLDKARMLYKIIKKDPIDVGKIVWKVVEVASKAAHATAALPYGLLITKILLENDVPVRDGLEGDSWKPQMSAIARGTLGKTQGQSRKHRAGTDPASLESIAARLDEALALIKKMQSDHKKDMNKFKADVKEMRKALLHCENDSSTNESEDGAKSEDGTGGKNEAESDDGTGNEEDGTEGESGNDSEDSDNNEDGDE
ncbi:hypothetical protein RHSIM_Rhsim02G0102100 [Rhododendron simsii]|uniref:Putative plant transposon protein domain-containing protein n=1 Tax=Rhododendron simsii TaxID=118357 RepID=A0A834LZE8_RHOSS|nr:hypothetical protein RHSIM_Rhsim02G0102100 [Rhododendron simsii]